MVKDPPTDLEDVTQALGPQGRSQDSRGDLGTVPSVCGPIDAERYGGYSIRTNPVHLAPEPTEPLLVDNHRTGCTLHAGANECTRLRVHV